MSEQPEKTRFGLNAAEFENLMQAVRYGIIIVITVLLTFFIVATAAEFLGYEPPARGETIKTTEEARSLADWLEIG